LNCHNEAQHFLSIAAPLSILSASFLGSGHCAGMCGGLATTIGRNRVSAFFYHAGRMISYTVAGALAGSIGKSVFFAKEISTILTSFTAIIFAASFIFMGMQIWRGKAPHMPGGFHLTRLFSRMMNKTRGLNLAPHLAQFVAGVFTLLLPCGWLYGFLVGAAATGSAFAGAGFMFIFSLGTLPALVTFSVGMHKGVFARLRSPRISGSVFIALGFLTLWLRLVPHS
jgi:sulfite exporter TauE/SafE